LLYTATYHTPNNNPNRLSSSYFKNNKHLISRIKEDGAPEDCCVMCWFVRNMTYVGRPESKRYKHNKIFKKDILTKLNEKKTLTHTFTYFST